MSNRNTPTPSLRHNFAWTFSGNVIYMACQWGILMALAKLGSPEMVGQFALGLALTAPLMVLSNLQLRGVQATDARGEYTFSQYFGLRLLTTALALALIAAFNFSSPVTLLIGLSKAVESISDVIFGFLQRLERMRSIAIALMLKGLLGLPALACAIYLTRSVAWGVAAMLSVWTAVLFAYEMPLVRRLGFRVPTFEWNRAVFARLTVLTLPLGLVMMLISLNGNIPRYFVEHYQGNRALGIYAALSYLPVAGQAVINAVGQAASTRLALYYAEGRIAAFAGLLGRILALGALFAAAMTAAAAIGGEPLLALMYQAQYAGQRDVFVLIIGAGGISYIASFLAYAATAARYFRVQLPVFCIVAATTLAASALLIPSRGLMGAAFALLYSSIAQLVLFAGIVAYALRHVPRRSRTGPVRVLHVVGGLNRAGVETWLMHTLRGLDRERYRVDFLVHGAQPYHFEAEAVSLDAGVVRCLHPENPWKYARNLRRVFREHGPYDAVHCHVHYFSGIAVWLARLGGVPVRIVHSHLESPEPRRFYAVVARWLILRHSTLLLATSEPARRSLFGADATARIFPYSLDLAPFRRPVDRAEIRRRLGIPLDALVVGHVGRFDPQKNHAFLVKIAEAMPGVQMLLVGDGPLRPGIQKQLPDAIFTGVSGDVPALMMGAMDVFVFPSLYEGLGLVVVEAQAAGLPCVISDTVPQEAEVIPELIHRLPLSADSEVWAQAIRDAMDRPRPTSQAHACDRIERSAFGRPADLAQFWRFPQEKS